MLKDAALYKTANIWCKVFKH